MSKVKRILSVIMAMVMVLAMSVPTFAAATVNPTTITVNGANGATLKYVQIVKADATDPSGWVFADVDADGHSVYGDAVKTAFGVDTYAKAIKALTTLGKTETPANANASAGKINSSDALAAALDGITVSETSVTATSDSYVLTADATAGLYVIVADQEGFTYNRMLAYVAYNDDATALLPATVTAKGSKDQVYKKIVDEDGSTDTGKTVTAGDTIHYEVSTQYPFYPANADNTSFVVTDTLVNATFVQDSVEIAGMEAGKDYTVAFNDKVMTITFIYKPEKAGQTVTITYAATVDATISTTGDTVKNNAVSTTATGYTVAEVISDSAEFTVTKVDVNDKHPIDGADFTLYVEDTDGKETLTYKGNTVSVTKVETKTTSTDGTANFKGLDPEKTYYVKETKAPAGYSINTDVFKLTGADQKTVESPAQTLTDKNGVEYTKVTTTTTVTDYTGIEVPDTKLSSLPSTGGIGTTIFTIGGCAIMIVAAGLFFATRRKTQK